MPPTAREELINKIYGLREIDSSDGSLSDGWIADHVLSNYVKKECLVPIEKALNELDDTVQAFFRDTSEYGSDERISSLFIAIEQALKLAKGEK